MSEGDVYAHGPKLLLSRRTALKLAGASGTVGMLQLGPGGLLGGALAQVDPATTFTFDLIDSDVDLRLQIHAVGMTLVDGELVAQGDGDTRLIVELGTQHTSEEVVDVDDSPPASALRSRAGQPVRLVFDVTPPVPFTRDAVLDWAGWPLVLDGRAAADEGSADESVAGPPVEDVTAMDVPEGLTISPLPGGRFEIDARPFRNARSTRSWTAALRTAVGGAVLPIPTSVRALHTPGYATGEEPADIPGFSRVLPSILRQRLVQATGDWSSTALNAYPDHEPITATGLTFGARGANGLLTGSWEGPGQLEDYTHALLDGRTDTATAVRIGYLLPFGHRVLLARISTRVFAADTDGTLTSVIETREEIQVEADTADTTRSLSPTGNRDWPFTDVTVYTPLINPSGQIPIGRLPVEEAFLVAGSDGDPFLFTYCATDRIGQRVTFNAPGIYLRERYVSDPDLDGVLDAVFEWLGEPAQSDLFSVDLAGGLVAFADPPTAEQGAVVSKETTELDFELTTPAATTAELAAAGDLPFGLRMRAAVVIDPSFRGLGGVQAEGVRATFDADWLDVGFGEGNFGNSFLVLDTPVGISFDTPVAELLAPDLQVGEFNLDLGASVGLPAPNVSWDPLEALQLGAAQLFGLLDLSQIIPPITIGGDPATQAGLPGLTIAPEGDLPDAPRLCVEFRWEPPLKSLRVGSTTTFVVTDDFADEGLDQNALDGPSGALVLFQQKIAVDPGGVTPTSTNRVELSNVALVVPPGLPLIEVYLATASYEVGSAGPQVELEIARIGFQGVINFLDVLTSRLLPGPSGPDIDLDELGNVFAGIDIAIPEIPLGIVVLDPFTVTVGLRVSVDQPEPSAVVLSIGEELRPVRLTLLGYGGSAYFEIEAAPHPGGLVALRAGVGVQVSFEADAFIARAYLEGELSVHFTFEEVELTNAVTGLPETVKSFSIRACIDLTAGIEALGLIDASVSADFCLTYNITTRLLTGSVVLSATVQIADTDLFSTSTEFTASYALGGTGFAELRQGDPPEVGFGDRFTEQQWLEYCGKFA